MAIFATATKPTPNSKVGIAFAPLNGKMLLTSVSKDGLFGGASSGLSAGMEMLSINGTSVVGKTTQEIKAILASLQSEVIIEAKPHTPRFLLYFTLGGSFGTDVLFEKPRFPTLFKNMNVPTRKWDRIIQSFTKDLQPALRQSVVMDSILQGELGAYTGKQMTKGYVGWGQESNHEKKVFAMTNQSAILHSNVSMVANNVVTKANALLNPHGILAELEFTVRQLPNFSTKQKGNNTVMIPTSMRFSGIDDAL